MDWLAVQWSRFWYWLQQDGNFPAVVLVFITGYYARVTRRALDAARTQAAASEKQFGMAQKQFMASMIPRVGVSVYPKAENYQHMCWSIENNSERDLLIQAAELRWTYPGKEWTHHLTQYPSGVFEPGRKLSNRETNAVPIPDAQWPADRKLTLNEAHEYMAIAVTVSDVARILAFRFEFVPGKGQKVTVVQEKS